MNLDNCLFSYWLAWFVGLLVGIALVVWVWVSDWVMGKILPK